MDAQLISAPQALTEILQTYGVAFKNPKEYELLQNKKECVTFELNDWIYVHN